MTKNTHNAAESCSTAGESKTRKTATGIDYSCPRENSGLSEFSPFTGRRKPCSTAEENKSRKTATGIDYSRPRTNSGLSEFSPLTGRRKL